MAAEFAACTMPGLMPACAHGIQRPSLKRFSLNLEVQRLGHVGRGEVRERALQVKRAMKR